MYDLPRILAQLREQNSPLFAQEGKLIRCFCHKLACLSAGQDPLFTMWDRELTFTYGSPSQLLAENSKIKPAQLHALYGFEPGEEPPLPLLLKGIQTFYSVLIKLIAFNLVSGARGDPRFGAEADIRALLEGRTFRKLGIANYCYEDWFSWILKYWDEEIQAQCLALRACLEEENTIACPESFIRSFRSDLLKHIYETVIPREIRHALGEYYTPDWLAACAVQNALDVSGGDACRLRFIDPTCGAGTFLTRVMRTIQSSSPDSLVRPEAVAGFDINALAVLTAKANFLAAFLGQLEAWPHLILPVYHYDVINTPALEGDNLVVDTNCDLVCSIPLSFCRQVVEQERLFCAQDFLPLLEAAAPSSPACARLWEQLTGYDPFNQLLISNILLNRIFAFYERRADVVVGNPPWVNWEFLPEAYKRKSQHLWPEYGLFHARGRELSFSKEDISSLITYISIDRFLAPHGCLSFVLRQAMFKSSLNGAGFRRFHLDKGDVDFRVLRVDDLCQLKPFDGISSRSALVLIRRDQRHTFPVPYNCWHPTPRFARAVRDPDLTAGSILSLVEVESMAAFPADGGNPASVWSCAPSQVRPLMDALLGRNSYKARTGVFTAGANGVYWLQVSGRTEGGALQVHNLVGRAKRKVAQTSALLEPEFVYPLVQGSDIVRWGVSSRSYILCPHTPQSRMWPVEEELLQSRAPLTYRYLLSFRKDLDARRGFSGWEKELQAQRFYSLLRVGEYTFAPYKVAWRYIARSFITAVITSARDPYLGEKLYLPNEKVVSVGLSDGDEAYYLCGILSSTPVGYCVGCYMNPTSISAHVLDKLRIPDYCSDDPLHRQISDLCRRGHQTDNPAGRKAIQAALDQAVGRLYRIPPQLLRLVCTSG